MRAFVTIQHPAHVHFFKHAVRELRDRGHEVFVYAREKDVAVELLRAYDITHRVLVGGTDSAFGLVRTQAAYEYRLLREARRRRPDVITAIGGVAAAHVAAVTDARSVVFTDTEAARLSNRITFPFADVVCTPACYAEDVGEKQVRYPGYHELAYLRPERFSCDESVRELAGVEADVPLVVLRLVAWNASHDVGGSGFADARDAIERLEAAGVQVLVTSEAPLPAAIADRGVRIPPHRMHDLLCAADLFVGESATMATESAVLGTPAVFVSNQFRGYIDDLEDKGLIYAFRDEHRHARALRRAVSLLEVESAVWERKRDSMLAETVDVTDVIGEVLLGAADSSRKPPARVAGEVG